MQMKEIDAISAELAQALLHRTQQIQPVIATGVGIARTAEISPRNCGRWRITFAIRRLLRVRLQSSAEHSCHGRTGTRMRLAMHYPAIPRGGGA